MCITFIYRYYTLYLYKLELYLLKKNYDLLLVTKLVLIVSIFFKVLILVYFACAYFVLTIFYKINTKKNQHNI